MSDARARVVPIVMPSEIDTVLNSIGVPPRGARRPSRPRQCHRVVVHGDPVRCSRCLTGRCGSRGEAGRERMARGGALGPKAGRSDDMPHHYGRAAEINSVSLRFDEIRLEGRICWSARLSR
jgi:hypothetical protein